MRSSAGLCASPRVFHSQRELAARPARDVAATREVGLRGRVRASKVQRAARGKIRELLLQLDRALAPEIVEVRLDLRLDRE